MYTSSIKTYFPGLNGLRFIAASLVIINHIETTKYFSGCDNLMRFPFFTSIGGLSVTLFFVLSGFLITYLLIEEKERIGFLDIKKFYIKRALRIWPLYFLILFLALFVLNRIDLFHLSLLSDSALNDFETKLFLFLVMLPNVVAVIFPSIPYIHHTWSIGVEEQFYLIWPLIVGATKNYFKTFLIIIASFVFFCAILRFISNHTKVLTSDESIIKIFDNISLCFSMLRIGPLAIGGVGALLVFYKKERILRWIYRKDIQWLTITLILTLFIIGPNIPLVKHEFYSILFCIVIINLASNTNSVLQLENKVLNFLGKISYGVYMYHPLVIGLCIAGLRFTGLFTPGDIGYDITLYIMTFLLTIPVAFISYYYLEIKFIRIKDQVLTTSKF